MSAPKPPPGVADASTGDYVQSAGCDQRFVGGDLTSRLTRFAEHACPGDSPTARALLADPEVAQWLA